MFELLYPETPAQLYPRPSFDRPGQAANPGGEMLPLIREDGTVYGKAPRNWCHGGSQALHPVVHLHIIDRSGKLYLQKRAESKELFPGLWDTSVGGHVAYGESIREALLREADEELGYQKFNPIHLGQYVYEAEGDRELVVVFATVAHPALKPNQEEVSEGRWWTVSDIDGSLGKGAFTPNFEEEFAQLRDKLLSLL